MKREDITKLFPDATKEQLDQLMALNGSDINAAKGDAERLKQQLADAQAALAAAKNPEPDPSTEQKLQALQDELSAMKTAEAVRTVREKVAKSTGIPAALLTGDTEDVCTAQAQAIKEYSESAKKPGYPGLADGGDPPAPASGKTRDHFAEWFNENIK